VAATVHPIRTLPRLAAYEPPAGCFDEAFEAPGRVPPSYSGVLSYIDGGPPQRIAAALAAEQDRDGVRFRTDAGDRTFPLDPVPRLSTHPTVRGDAFEPRRIDLRPYVAAAGGSFRLLPAALTRCTPSTDSLHVDSSRGGGAKDTWTVP
jgi:uncharacterized circularly permuted ATP-grasp superfamily protein